MAEQTQDPIDFVRSMWSKMGIPIPGMVTPTFDTQDLTKRITDLKAVESWLRMNLSMLQMTIQNLELQNTALSAVQTISGLTAGSGGLGDDTTVSGDAPSVGDALHQATLWPWSLMQQVQAQLQKSAEEEAAAAPKAETESARKSHRKPTAKKPG